MLLMFNIFCYGREEEEVASVLNGVQGVGR